MVIEVSYQGIIKKKSISIDLKENSVCILNKKTNDALRYTMRCCLEKGCSVITYGSYTDYYKYIYDIAPSFLSNIEYSELINDASVPFLRNSCHMARETVKKVFEDYMMSNRYNYLNKRMNGQQFQDPNRNQAFYQIKAGDITKQKVVTEAFLSNVISQALYEEPLREIVIFLDMPYKPITKTTLEMLEKIEDTPNINLICLYSEDKYDNQPYAITLKGNKYILKTGKKEYVIADEEIY